MDTERSTLIQYRVLADHRLHFGRLFFQVIGINLALMTAAMTAIAIGKPAWWAAARLLAGLLLIGTAFVARRLHFQEERYASAMHSIEADERGMIQVHDDRRRGARWLVVGGLALVGLMLAIEAGGEMLVRG